MTTATTETTQAQYIVTDPSWGMPVHATLADVRKQADIFGLNPDSLTTDSEYMYYEGSTIATDTHVNELIGEVNNMGDSADGRYDRYSRMLEIRRELADVGFRVDVDGGEWTAVADEDAHDHL